MQSISKFKSNIKAHYRAHGRDLPWRHTKDPYRILVSEIMLQQTQVARVLQKYPEFLKHFPNFKSLAEARQADVLRVWQGMGYNRRALALTRIAVRVRDDYRGRLPRDQEILKTFPGIGSNTAGAIAAFAFNVPAPFIETNIRRTFIHFFFSKRRKVHDDEIIPLVEKTLDRKNSREWYYALMDYGSALALSLSKGANPNRKSAHYRRQSAFEGSSRQVRGKILRILTRNVHATHRELTTAIPAPTEMIAKALEELFREGFIEVRQSRVTIKA